MNDFIDPAQYSLYYYTINDAYIIGPRAFMSKTTLKMLFVSYQLDLMIETSLEYTVCWHQYFYADTFLPLGLRLAEEL